MLDHPEGPVSAEIERLRCAVLDLLSKQIEGGMDMEDAALGAIAAGASIYGSLMGGIKPGQEDEATRVFGSWVVDNIIGMTNEKWPTDVPRPKAS